MAGMIIKYTIGVALLTGAGFILNHLGPGARPDPILSDQVLVLRALSAPQP